MSSHAKRTAVENRTPAPRASMLAALDIGASKITCFIGSVGQGPGPLRVAGVGTQAAKGVRNGAIVDLDAAERAVRAAVSQAERMAETTVSEVVVSVSGFGVRAEQANGEISLSMSAEIGVKERRKVVGAALQHVRTDGRTILHVTPSFFVLDGERVRDPRGMYGKRLGVAITVVTVPTPQWRNIVLCVERAMYTISGSVAAPYAAALGALAEDDLELGALVIDMGARSTTAALFQAGALLHVDAVPIGSDHVTHDIAHCLGTSAAAAERLKVVHGSAIASLNEDNMMIDVPRMTESGLIIADQAARSMLTGIVRPRVEETLELLRDRLRAGGLDKLNAGRRIVLTGGGSQLNGVRELAARVFEGHVRIGRPQRFTGLGDAVAGPGFSVASGLLRWGIERPTDMTGAPSQLREPPSHPVARAMAWLKENF
jgi:cell division protein FtsA